MEVVKTMVELTQFEVHVDFLEPTLGTAPSDPEVYKSFIVPKKFEDAKTLPLGSRLGPDRGPFP
jgi:hypothetical protein